MVTTLENFITVIRDVGLQTPIELLHGSPQLPKNQLNGRFRSGILRFIFFYTCLSFTLIKIRVVSALVPERVNILY